MSPRANSAALETDERAAPSALLVVHPWLPVAAVFLLAAVVRGLSVADALSFDEFYNILAARSLVENGTLSIGSGDPYLRARVFTYAVAGSMRLLGESLVAARIPSVVFGALWVTVVFVGVRRYATTTAAWIAALLLCFDPHAIGLSQIGRMYAMHALAFWAGAMLLYQALYCESSVTRRRLLIIATIAAFGLALHLQRTTLIGLGSLLAWPVIARLAGKRGVEGRGRRIIALALLACAVGAVFLAFTDPGIRLWDYYRSTNPRQTLMGIDPRIYFWWLAADYPVLLGLLPLAALLALRSRPRLTLYCGVFLALAIVFHSVAASRQIRYFHYALPAFFIVWALAVDSVIPQMLRLVSDIAAGVNKRLPRLPTPVIANTLLASSLVFVVAVNPAASRALDEALPGIERPLYGNNYWPDVVPQLAELATDPRRVVVSSMIPQTMFFLRRGDVEIGLNYRPERDAPTFSRDWRVGTPVISTRPELEVLVACYPSGLIIVHGHYWRRPWGLTAAMADFVEQEMTPVSLDASSDEVRAFAWDGVVPTATQDECPVFDVPAGAARAAVIE